MGSGQCALGSLLLWGLRCLMIARGQSAQEVSGTITKLLEHFCCSKDLSLPQLLSRDDAHFQVAGLPCPVRTGGIKLGPQPFLGIN